MLEKDQNTQSVTDKKFKRLKQEAKKHSKSNDCILADSQNAVARDEGFPNWKALKKAVSTTETTTSGVLHEIHTDVSHD